MPPVADSIARQRIGGTGLVYFSHCETVGAFTPIILASFAPPPTILMASSIDVFFTVTSRKIIKIKRSLIKINRHRLVKLPFVGFDFY